MKRTPQVDQAWLLRMADAEDKFSIGILASPEVWKMMNEIRISPEFWEIRDKVRILVPNEVMEQIKQWQI